MGDPVQSEAAGGQRPEEFDTGGLAKVQDEVEEDGGKCGEENESRGSLALRRFAFAQEEGESEEETEEKSREKGMTIRAIEGKERGRARKFAQRVDIGDGPCNDHGNGGRAREPRASDAFKGVGG